MTAPAPYKLDSAKLANVPADMTQRPQFVMWSYVVKPGTAKPTKLPYQVSGEPAKSNDPSTWTTFDAAVAEYNRDPSRWAGIGYVFSEDDPFTGIDLDNCLDVFGSLEDWAVAPFRQINAAETYGEISPSGRGLKIITTATLDGPGRRMNGQGPDKTGAIEMYDRVRFFTLTGDRYHKCSATIGYGDEGIGELYASLKPKRDCKTDFANGNRSTIDQYAAADRVARCMKYIAKIPDSISGQGGHDRCLQVACETVRFDLSNAEAWQVMRHWSDHRSGGEPWTDREIEHKLDSAEKLATRGERLKDDREPARKKSASIKDLEMPPAADDQDEPEPLPLIVTAGQLAAVHASLPEPIIDGLLRRREVGNIAAAPKSNKSFTVMDLGLSVATGRLWLNTHPTAAGNVLFIDNELFPSVWSDRLPKIASARGIMRDDYADRIHVMSLRGHRMDIHQLGAVFRTIEPGAYNLIVLDALYRFFPKGFDENSNANMTELYNRLDQYASMADAALMVVHHTSKGGQAGKATTDVGAGAGAQSRAADLHLVLRPHEEQDCMVIDAVARSFPPPDPIALRWQYPVWSLDETLDPTLLRVERKPGGRPRKDRTETTEGKAPPEPWTPERFAQSFVGEDPTEKTVIVGMATIAGLSQREAGSLLAVAGHRKLIHQHRISGSNKAYFATREQTIAETADCKAGNTKVTRKEGVSVSRAPPIPPSAKAT